MLRAIYHGKEKDHKITSINLTDEQWLFLQQATNPKGKTDKSYKGILTSPLTGKPVHLQTSRNGLRYFALYRHTPADMEGYGEPETWHHVEIKDAIVRAARALGYKALPEVSRGEALSKTRDDVSATDHSWIADVLIQRPGKRLLAIEVQWSKQTTAEFKRRQDRYEQDDVDCIWLYRYADVNTDHISMNKKTGELLDNNGVPIFKLYEKTQNKQHYTWMPWNRKGTIHDWLTLILNEDLCTHSPRRPEQALEENRARVAWGGGPVTYTKRFLYTSGDYPAIHADAPDSDDILNFFRIECPHCSTNHWTWTRINKQGKPLPSREVTVTDAKPDDLLAAIQTREQYAERTNISHPRPHETDTTYLNHEFCCCHCGEPLPLTFTILNTNCFKPAIEGRWCFDFTRRWKGDWSPVELGLQRWL